MIESLKKQEEDDNSDIKDEEKRKKVIENELRNNFKYMRSRAIIDILKANDSDVSDVVVVGGGGDLNKNL